MNAPMTSMGRYERMSISRLRAHASFARVWERIGTIYERAWAFSPQAEHFFAGADGDDEPSATDEYPWPLPAHPLFSPALPFCGSTLYPSEHGALLAVVLGSSERGDLSPRCHGLN
jgi:hypothetical protein